MRTVDAMKPLTAGELLGLWQRFREKIEDPLDAAVQRCHSAGELLLSGEGGLSG